MEFSREESSESITVALWNACELCKRACVSQLALVLCPEGPCQGRMEEEGWNDSQGMTVQLVRA